MHAQPLCSDTGLNDANRQGQADAVAQALRDWAAYGTGILKATYADETILYRVNHNEFLNGPIGKMYVPAIPRETTTAVKPELLAQRVRDW